MCTNRLSFHGTEVSALDTRRLRGDEIEVFKIFNGHENIDHKIFVKIKTDKTTRGHDFTLVKGQSRLYVMNEWDRLCAF